MPISLIVTLEIVHFFHAMFMGFDVDMFDWSQDYACRAASSNIIEDLGQVEYVFSDKTGTLTCNIMEFKKFSTEFSSFEITEIKEDETPPQGQGDRDLSKKYSTTSRNSDIGFINQSNLPDHRGTA